jgi:GNAT superfamily N-acetyltransferase
MADHFVPTTRNKSSATSGAMEIRIRKASVEDLNHILHHRIAMFKEMGFQDAMTLERVENASREYFNDSLRSGKYIAWLAEGLNGQVVGGGGIVVADWPGYPGETLAERAWILNMYTEPAARRFGVAKRLLEIMVEWCRVRGFTMVSLHASSAGRPLYERVGFQQTNEMSCKL